MTSIVPHVPSMSGFQSSAANVGELAKHAGTAASIAREESEMKASIVLARANPRDQQQAYVNMINSCRRIGFAESAIYSFPRGNQQVEGPTIDLAREMARIWGNIRTGARIVSEDEHTVHIKGYANDLETNTYVEAEDKFSKLIQRKDRSSGVTKWVVPDERDLRELVNRRAAFLVRNCILAVMPPDFVDDALQQARATKRASASGELKIDRAGAVKKMVLAFNDLAITPKMLANHIGHSLDDITDAELAGLKGVYKSIRDGNSSREEHFVPASQAKAEPAKVAESKADSVAATVEARLKDKVKVTKPSQLGEPVTDDDVNIAMR